MRSVKQKNVSLPPAYISKIARIKEKLGVSSDSEVIRRAIDDFAHRLGVLNIQETTEKKS